MTDTRQQLERIMTIEEVCSLAREQGMEVGRRLLIQGKLSGLAGLIFRKSETKEVVFNVVNGGRWSFDTLVVEENGSPARLAICERRYMVEGEYAIHLATYDKDTREYHQLLQGVKT